MTTLVFSTNLFSDDVREVAGIVGAKPQNFTWGRRDGEYAIFETKRFRVLYHTKEWERAAYINDKLIQFGIVIRKDEDLPF